MIFISINLCSNLKEQFTEGFSKSWCQAESAAQKETGEDGKSIRFKTAPTNGKLGDFYSWRAINKCNSVLEWKLHDIIKTIVLYTHAHVLMYPRSGGAERWFNFTSLFHFAQHATRRRADFQQAKRKSPAHPSDYRYYYKYIYVCASAACGAREGSLSCWVYSKQRVGSFVGSLTHSFARHWSPGRHIKRGKEKARQLEINYLLTFSMENQQRQLEAALSDADSAWFAIQQRASNRDQCAQKLHFRSTHCFCKMQTNC